MNVPGNSRHLLYGATRLRAAMYAAAIVAVLALAWAFLHRLDPRDHGSTPQPVEGSSGAVEWLTVGDPFAMILDSDPVATNAAVGVPLRLSIRRYARTFDEILLNHSDDHSYYHLVSFDILWLPALTAAGVLSPITEAELRRMGLEDPDAFYPFTIELNRFGGQLYGIPIQPHAELLWYRSDLLEAAGRRPPESLTELLELARLFHRPQERFYGICWNALRGQALGQTVSHFYAAFGGALIAEDGRVTVDTAVGERVVQFLIELMEVSPPDILTMAWDQRIDRFGRGQAAFTYGWTARAPMVERSPTSQVAGKVGYIAPPGWEAGRPAVPIGQWSIGIPAKLPAAERESALRAIAGLSSRSAYQLFAAHGLVGLHRRGMAEGLETPAYRAVADILESGQVSMAARPLLVEWPEIADSVGTIFHDVLLGKLAAGEALRFAQLAVEQLLAESGEEAR